MMITLDTQKKMYKAVTRPAAVLFQKVQFYTFQVQIIFVKYVSLGTKIYLLKRNRPTDNLCTLFSEN